MPPAFITWELAYHISMDLQAISPSHQRSGGSTQSCHLKSIQHTVITRENLLEPFVHGAELLSTLMERGRGGYGVLVNEEIELVSCFASTSIVPQGALRLKKKK